MVWGNSVLIKFEDESRLSFFSQGETTTHLAHCQLPCTGLFTPAGSIFPLQLVKFMDLLRRFGQFSSLLPFELVKSCQQVLFFWIWWADIWRVLFRRCKPTTDSRDITYWSGLTGNSCQLVKFVANGKMFRSLLSPDILPLNSFWRAKLSGLVLLLKYEGSVWICTHSCLDPGLGESSTILQSLEPSELTKEGGRRRHGRVDHSTCRTKQEEKFRQSERPPVVWNLGVGV